jgi:hypothetical protein
MESFVRIFNDAMELACLGLYEKKNIKDEERKFKFSPILKKSLDKFSLLNYMINSKYHIEEEFFPTNETKLIKAFNLDINELIDELPEEIKKEIQKTDWYMEEAFVGVGKDNCYYCTESLLDIINNDRAFRKASKARAKELELASQKFIYELFKKDQDEYCEIRNFLEQKKYAFITNQMFLKDEAIQNFKKKYPGIYDEAYENINSAKIKICKHCGLVLRELSDGTLYCASERCSNKPNGFSDASEIQINEEIIVLKENVARYIYYPGVLEQKIASILRKNKIDFIQWPNKDEWDFQFNYRGQIWKIDAKDVKNPNYIIKDIKEKKKEKSKYDKGIYVVPSDRKKIYLDRIRRSIDDSNKFKCITIAEFKRMIEEE